jgi:uncharacterized protein involved in type VI secretion and phage assembly
VHPGGPRPEYADQSLYGVYYAVVTQNKDDDKGLGRVKVKLPWLDNADQDQAAWALVATPMAGDKFGMYFQPDVGDVVIVMFIAGDIAAPVVLGGAWSKTDKTAEDNSGGKNDFRGYRSRAGSRMVLDDSSNGKVLLADKTNKNVLSVGSFSSGGSGSNASAPPKPAGAGSGGVILAAMDGKLNITCKNGTLKVQGLQIKMTAKTDVQFKATGDLTIEGAMTSVTSSAGGDYDGASTKIGP